MNARTIKTAIALVASLCLQPAHGSCMWSWIGTPIASVGATDRNSMWDTVWSGRLTFDTSRDGLGLFFGHVGNYGAVTIGGDQTYLPRNGYPWTVPAHNGVPGFSGGGSWGNSVTELWLPALDGDGQIIWNDSGQVWYDAGYKVLNPDPYGGRGWGYSYLVERNSQKLEVFQMMGSDDWEIAAGYTYRFGGGQGAYWSCNGPFIVKYGNYGSTPMDVWIAGMYTGVGNGTLNEISLAPVDNWPIEMSKDLLLPAGRLQMTTSPGTAVNIKWDNGIIQGRQGGSQWGNE